MRLRAVAVIIHLGRKIAAIEITMGESSKAIERAVGVARRRAEKVDQAILVRAFRGKL